MNSTTGTNQNSERVVRHAEYYIHGGDVIFRVENTLFRVHRYFFTRDSAFFRDKLPHPPPPGEFTKGSSDSNPLVLEDTHKVDFERFLWVFYNPKYSLYDGNVEEWTSILKLSHQWDFIEVKTLALRELEQLEIPPLRKIVIYHSYAVDRSLLQAAYAALTIREEPITIEEGRELGLETALQLARAREIVRASVPGGKGAGGNQNSLANAAGIELEALIRDLFQLPLPSGPPRRRAKQEEPIGRVTPIGGRDDDTPFGTEINGLGSPVPNPVQGMGSALIGTANGHPNGVSNGLANGYANGTPNSRVNRK